MLKKILGAVLTALMYASTVNAAALTGTTCPGNGCTTQRVTGAGSVGIQVTGTFVGTFQFEQTIDGINWVALYAEANGSTTPVTSGTSTGFWTATVAGSDQVRVRLSDYTSGAASVTVSTAIAKAGASGGGGNPFDQNLNTTDNVAFDAVQTQATDTGVPISTGGVTYAAKQLIQSATGTPYSLYLQSAASDQAHYGFGFQMYDAEHTMYIYGGLDNEVYMAPIPSDSGDDRAWSWVFNTDLLPTSPGNASVGRASYAWLNGFFSGTVTTQDLTVNGLLQVGAGDSLPSTGAVRFRRDAGWTGTLDTLVLPDAAGTGYERIIDIASNGSRYIYSFANRSVDINGTTGETNIYGALTVWPNGDGSAITTKSGSDDGFLWGAFAARTNTDQLLISLYAEINDTTDKPNTFDWYLWSNFMVQPIGGLANGSVGIGHFAENSGVNPVTFTANLVVDGPTGVVSATVGFRFPTSDPHIVGVWWDNAGTLTKSAG